MKRTLLFLIYGLLVLGLDAPSYAQLSSEGSQVWRQGVDGLPNQAQADESFGFFLANGDFNGDLLEDLAISSRDNDFDGAITILYGTGAGLSSAGAQFFEEGKNGVPGAGGQGNDFGWGTIAADFNGDGFDDLATATVSQQSGAGAAYVLYGSRTGIQTQGVQFFQQGRNGLPGVPEAADVFGFRTGAGDFNNDGYGDLVIAVPGDNGDSGGFHVIPGSRSGLTLDGDQYLSPQSPGLADTANTRNMGIWVATGDFNGDGFDDLSVAENDQRGGFIRIRIFPGGPNLFEAAQSKLFTFPITGLSPTQTAPAGRDFDGDGFDDLPIRVSGNPSEVRVLRGSAQGLMMPTAQDSFSEATPGMVGDRIGFANFGLSIAAGDYDGDGRADLAVGSSGGVSEGQINVLYSSGNGLTTTNSQQWRQGAGGLADRTEQNDQFGNVLRAGDFNGDGVEDLAVAVSREDGGQGIVHVLYGKPAAGNGLRIAAVLSAGLGRPFVKRAAPNAILSVFGTAFLPQGQSRVLTGDDIANGRLPTQLGGVCVEMNGQRAPLFAVFPGQINFQSVAAAGAPARVRVLTNCGAGNQQASNFMRSRTGAAAPEFFFFTAGADGTSPVAAINETTGQFVGAPGLLPGATFAAAKPGEVVTVFLTGLGATTPGTPAGALASGAAPAQASVAMTLGGRPLDVIYAGASPGFAGLYQASFRVPAGLAPGPQPLGMSAGLVVSKPGAILAVGN